MKNLIKKHRILIHIFAEALLIILVSYIFCWPLKVDGGSMSPAYLNGERVVVSRISARTGRMGRGDVVICRIEQDGAVKKAIKRIVGLPGESVEINGGFVYIDGVLSDEEYAVGSTSGSVSVLLGDDEYFVLGDDRAKSFDSRHAGAVLKGDILAKVIFKIF